MKTVSIGTMGEDSEFAIIATMNNKDSRLSDEAFAELVNHVASELCRALMCEVQVLEREDAPDYVCTDDETWG